MDLVDSAATSSAGNMAYDWDSFDSAEYCDHNYARLRDDDQLIVEAVRDFFARSAIRPGAHGVDVGPGPNLYPSLAMLPFCERVDLWEMSASNVSWLQHQQARGFDERWDVFWRVFAKNGWDGCGVCG